MILRTRTGISVWSFPTIIFNHSEYVVPHDILNRSHRTMMSLHYVVHLLCLTVTIGIQRTIFLFRPSNGDIFLPDMCSFYHDFDKLQGSSMQIIAQIRTSERHHGVDASLLSLKWGIGLEKAKNTINNITQLNIRSSVLPGQTSYRRGLGD